MKILAFAASNSSESINRRLALHVAHRVRGAEVESLDLNSYEMPIFSEQRELALGQPDEAKAFYKKLGEADALVIAFAEHNGSYSAAWKNLLDWTSRIDRRFFQDKPALFLATSPGPGGAGNVLAQAADSAPHFGAELIDSVSVPRFNDVYDPYRDQVVDALTDRKLRDAVRALERRLGLGNAMQGELNTLLEATVLPERRACS